MKKSIILASVALLAMTVSCDLFKNTFKEQDVKVNESSTVPADDFVGLKNSPTAGATPEGDLTAEIWADQPLKVGVDPSLGKIKAPGTLLVDGSKLPDVAVAKDGVAPDNAGLLFTVKNPSSLEMKVEPSLQVDGGTIIQLPPVTVGANKEAKIMYCKAPLEPDCKDAPTSETLDEAVVVSRLSAINFGKPFKKLEVKDIVLSPVGTKAAALAGDSVDIEFNAKFCALLSFPKETVITIHRSFHDLNIHLDRLSEYTFNKYGITINVTNTIPFDIFASASSSEGITAVADQAVKAGSVDNPVQTTAVITVTDNSGNKVSDIENADLTLVLTAAKNGARLPKDVKIKIDVDKITPLE